MHDVHGGDIGVSLAKDHGSTRRRQRHYAARKRSAPVRLRVKEAARALLHRSRLALFSPG